MQVQHSVPAAALLSSFRRLLDLQMQCVHFQTTDRSKLCRQCSDHRGNSLGRIQSDSLDWSAVAAGRQVDL